MLVSHSSVALCLIFVFAERFRPLSIGLVPVPESPPGSAARPVWRHRVPHVARGLFGWGLPSVSKRRRLFRREVLCHETTHRCGAVWIIYPRHPGVLVHGGDHAHRLAVSSGRLQALLFP